MQPTELDLLQKSIAELPPSQKQATLLGPEPSNKCFFRFVSSSAPVQKGTIQTKAKTFLSALELFPCGQQEFEMNWQHIPALLQVGALLWESAAVQKNRRNWDSSLISFFSWRH